MDILQITDKTYYYFKNPTKIVTGRDISRHLYHNILLINCWHIGNSILLLHIDGTEPVTNYQNKYYSVNDWKDKYNIILFIGINLVLLVVEC